MRYSNLSVYAHAHNEFVETKKTLLDLNRLIESAPPHVKDKVNAIASQVIYRSHMDPAAYRSQIYYAKQTIEKLMQTPLTNLVRLSVCSFDGLSGECAENTRGDNQKIKEIVRSSTREHAGEAEQTRAVQCTEAKQSVWERQCEKVANPYSLFCKRSLQSISKEYHALVIEELHAKTKDGENALFIYSDYQWGPRYEKLDEVNGIIAKYLPLKEQKPLDLSVCEPKMMEEIRQAVDQFLLSAGSRQTTLDLLVLTYRLVKGINQRFLVDGKEDQDVTPPDLAMARKNLTAIVDIVRFCGDQIGVSLPLRRQESTIFNQKANTYGCSHLQELMRGVFVALGRFEKNSTLSPLMREAENTWMAIEATLKKLAATGDPSLLDEFNQVDNQELRVLVNHSINAVKGRPQQEEMKGQLLELTLGLAKGLKLRFDQRQEREETTSGEWLRNFLIDLTVRKNQKMQAVIRVIKESGSVLGLCPLSVENGVNQDANCRASEIQSLLNTLYTHNRTFKDFWDRNWKG